jgi:hypothetical protein
MLSVPLARSAIELPGIAHRTTVAATLAAPVGNRVVLDLQQGTPVPVVLVP